MTIRLANAEDVHALVALFAADALGGHGDTTDPAYSGDYEQAFRRISESPNDSLYVAERGGTIVGTFQITFTTTMTGRGSLKATIEAVQVLGTERSRGIGSAMLVHAIDVCHTEGVSLVQLMSNKNRTRAHEFYERLGFQKSHTGFKMKL